MKRENVLRQIRKTTKNHPLEVANKFVETYYSSNAAAHDPEERVQLHKPRHYTIYKCKKKKEKTSEEDDLLTKAIKYFVAVATHSFPDPT